MHDWEHLVSLFSAKVFFAEAKLILAELGQTCQYPGEYLHAYIKRFHEKSLNYCYSVSEDLFVDVAFMA